MAVAGPVPQGPEEALAPNAHAADSRSGQNDGHEEEEAERLDLRSPPQAVGPRAEYEVLAPEARLLRQPLLEAEEAARLPFGGLVWGTPHVVHGRAWLQIDAASSGAEVAWAQLKDRADRALFQVAPLMEVTVRGSPKAEELTLHVPHSAKVARVKEDLRRKLGPQQQGALRLARRVSGGLFQEPLDDDPTSQDLTVLPPDLAIGAAQVRRDLLEVARDSALRFCTVEQAGPLDLIVTMAPHAGGFVKLRVKCPEDYPLQNCTVDVDVARSPLEEDGWCGILSKGPLVGKNDPAWKPTFTMRRLLLGVVRLMDTWPGFLFSSLIEAVRPFVDAQLRVVYLAIGCGGPFLAQKFPRAVQRKHAGEGGRCLIVLIDPFLTSPPRPRNEWRVTHDKLRKTVVCTCNALVEDWDIEGMEEFISLVSDAGVRPDCLMLADHRGASFMCAPCPINMHLAPVVQAKFSVAAANENVSLDAGAKVVIRAVHGITGETKEEQEIMEAMLHGSSALSFGCCNLTARQLYLMLKVDKVGGQFRTEMPSELLLVV